MTNGEKIREVFPNARIKYHKATDLVDEHVTVFINGCDTCQDYSMDWWDSEYKEPATKSDLGVDCISREAVLNKILKFSVTDGRSVSVTGLWTEVNELPSVTPIRPKGYWIDTREISTNRRGQIVHEVICSECSGIAYFRSMGNKYIGANLCPNCGADMREVEE